MSKVSRAHISLPPGSVIIIGPCGRLQLKISDDCRPVLVADNCDFYGPSAHTPAMRALVNEIWAERTEYGNLPLPAASVILPPAVRVSRPDPVIPRRATRLPKRLSVWQRLLKGFRA